MIRAVVALSIFLIAGPAATQENAQSLENPALESDQDVDPECSAWSMKGMRLGMSLAEARQIYPDLHRDQSYDGRGIGAVRYWWHTEGMENVNNTILTDAVGDASAVVTFSVNVNTSELTLDELRGALIEKWGPPTTPINASGLATMDKWSDDQCDVEVQLLGMSPKLSKGKKPKLLVAFMSKSAKAQHTERTENEKRDKARSAVE